MLEKTDEDKGTESDWVGGGVVGQGGGHRYLDRVVSTGVSEEVTSEPRPGGREKDPDGGRENCFPAPPPPPAFSPLLSTGHVHGF